MPERADQLPYQLLIVNHKERLDDRFLATDVQVVFWQGQPVGILTVIEIESPWHPTRELADAISHSVANEFHNSPNQSVLTKFEFALKRTNRLIEAAESAVPMSIVAALVVGNELHFSTIGRGRLLLRQGRSLIDTTTETGQKTFAALTSGDLASTNLVLLATESLGQAAQTLDPSPVSAEAIVQTVSRHHSPGSIIGAGIFLRYSPDAPSEERFFWETAASRPNEVHFGEIVPTRSRTQKDQTRAGFQSLAATGLDRAKRLTDKLYETLSRQWQRLSPKAQIGAVGFAVLIGIGLIFFRGGDFKQPASQTTPANPLAQVARASDATMLKDLSTNFTSEHYAALPADDQAIILRRLQSANITFVPAPAAVSQTTQPIRAIDVTGESLMVIDMAGQLWQAKDKSLTPINQKRLISNPVSLTALGETRVVVSDGTGNLWLFDGSADQPLPLALPKELATGQKLLQKFEGNLYSLLASGEVYRFSAFNGSLAQPTQLTKAGTLPFSGIADFTIPGQFLAVSATGQLQDFRRNQLGPLAVTLPNLGNGLRLDGLPASPASSFFSTTGRLLSVYLNPPALTGHYFLALPSSITDLAVRSAKSIWIASDRDIYEVTLP